MRSERSVVIVPSRTIDKFHEPAAETQAYEERLLCLTLMLRDPGLRVVYVTSSPVAEPIVDYYLSLLPIELRDDARARLTMISADDPSIRPLSAKLLERPTLLTRIRWAIPDHDDAYLVPYVSTELEYELGRALGIPVHGADPALAYLGTKSGGRELFARAGVPLPLGVEHVRTPRRRRRRDRPPARARPRLAQVVVKLDAGVSGEGNAIVELRRLPRPGARTELRADRRARRRDAPAGRRASRSADYLERLERGGIVEERIVGRELRSPSVQLELGDGRGADRLHPRPDPRRRRLRRLPLPGRAPPTPARSPPPRAASARCWPRPARSAAPRSTSSSPATAPATGARTRSSSTCARAARRIRWRRSSCSAAAPTTPSRRRSAPPCGSPRHYVATDHLESPRLRALGHGGLLSWPRCRGWLRTAAASSSTC